MNPHFYTIIRANPAIARIQRVYLVGEGPGDYSLNAFTSDGNLCIQGDDIWPIPPGGNPAAELRKFLTERPEAIAKQLLNETTSCDAAQLRWELLDGDDITASLRELRKRNRDHLVLLDLIEFFVNARKNTT